MKFLCPNCKTKYQISEEKVAGRSVKIKCRSCGFLIRISQPPSHGDPGTATVAFELPPPAYLTQDRPPVVISRLPPASGAPRSGSAPAGSSSVPRPGTSEPAAGHRLPPPRVHSSPAVSPAGSPAVASPPRPGASNPRLAATSLRQASQAAQGTSGPGGARSAAPPRPAGTRTESLSPTSVRAAASPARGEARSLSARPAGEVAGRARGSSIAPRDALAGAFAKAVDRVPVSSPEGLASGDEWWVGINDAPVGPLKLTELRIKAAQGKVGPQSLVWREGFEDWAPVCRFPELLAIVEEATSAARMSRPSPIPASAILPKVTGPVTMADPFASPTPADAASGAHAVSRAPVSVTSQGPGNRPAASTAAAVGGLPVAAAPVAAGPAAVGMSALTGATGSGPVPEPGVFALGGSVSALAGAVSPPASIAPTGPGSAGVIHPVAPDWDADYIPGLTRGRPIPAAAWAAVAAAILFGLTLGFVMFGGSGESETVAQAPSTKVDPGSVAARPTNASPQSMPQQAEDLTEEESTESAPGSGSSQKARARKTSGSGESESSARAPALTGLRGLAAVKGQGPTANPAGQGSGAGNGQGLSSDTLTRTVSRYKSSVSRSCWQPALDTCDKDAPTSARVSVTIQVAPSGQVDSVKSSGDPKGYRGLARCIESRVRAWRFPVSGSSTTVNVPFVFTAQ